MSDTIHKTMHAHKPTISFWGWMRLLYGLIGFVIVALALIWR